MILNYSEGNRYEAEIHSYSTWWRTLFFSSPIYSLPSFWNSIFYKLSTPINERERWLVSILRMEFLEDLFSTDYLSDGIELEGFFELLYESELSLGDFPYFSDKLIDEYRFFFPFYLDTIKLTKYKKLFCFHDHTFPDTHECSIEFINPLKPGGGVYRVSEGRILDLFPDTSDISNNSYSLVDPHTYTDLDSLIFLERFIEFLYLGLLPEGCTAGKYGLFFFISPKCSPESHYSISFIFIDKSFFVHDDI